MLETYDYVVLVFYFVFMVAIGHWVSHMNKDSSDYFRGGGSMTWWIVGATAFMTQFSAWTFTGAAGKAYVDGFIVAIVFFGNVLGYLVNFAWTSYRFRAMRRSTPLEAVRDRFGPENEQVFTWLQLPISFVYAAIWLNGLAIFSSQAFGIEQATTVWIVGIAVVLISVTGGAWAVVASDFVQMVLLMAMALLLFGLTLADDRVGGISGFTEKVPEHFFQWDKGAALNLVVLWVIANLIGQILKTNSILDSYRYLCAKDGRHARNAALLAAGLMFIGPFIWFIPPMAAHIIQPDMASQFPQLKNAQEGAYIFMAHEILPTGMLGLLLCGVYAATMSSMDSGLNRNAGIFVKSFYHPIMRPHASERELLLVGKGSSLAFGLLIILIALIMSGKMDLDLFNIMQLFGSLVAIPYAMPLVLGLFIKRVPPWAAWTTVLVGFLASVFIEGIKLAGFEIQGLKVESFGLENPTTREMNDFRLVASIFGNALVCTLWFVGTSVFCKSAPESYKKRADEFFKRINTPVDFMKEIGRPSDFRQGIMISKMLYIYGGFIALLSIFFQQDTLWARACFVLVGGIMAGVGGVLHWSALRFQAKEARIFAEQEAAKAAMAAESEVKNGA